MTKKKCEHDWHMFEGTYYCHACGDDKIETDDLDSFVNFIKKDGWNSCRDAVLNMKVGNIFYWVNDCPGCIHNKEHIGKFIDKLKSLRRGTE